MSYSSGRSQRRVAVRRTEAEVEHRPLREVHAEELGVARDVPREHRIGRRPPHRFLDRGADELAVVTNGGEDVGALEDRRHRDAHLLPGGARPGGEQQHREREDLGVGEAVHHAVLVGVLGLDQHADEVVGGLHAPRRDDRFQDGEDARRVAHEELADHERLVDAHAEAAGDGEHGDGGGAKSTLSSARPSSTKLSMSACTVCSIQLVIHHCALAGTNDGCTSAR